MRRAIEVQLLLVGQGRDKAAPAGGGSNGLPECYHTERRLRWCLLTLHTSLQGESGGEGCVWCVTAHLRGSSWTEEEKEEEGEEDRREMCKCVGRCNSYMVAVDLWREARGGARLEAHLPSAVGSCAFYMLTVSGSYAPLRN